MSNKYDLIQFLNVHNISEAVYLEDSYLQLDFKHWRASNLVNAGDRVVIEAQGRRVSGLVTYRDFDQWNNVWDIELTDANIAGGYSHWKQQFDGGKLVEINGEEVDLQW